MARAEATQRSAEAQLEHAESVTRSLSEASEAQSRADAAIAAAQEDIDGARKDLAQISARMDESIATSDLSVLDVADLAGRSQPLQTDFIKNEARVTSAREAAAAAKERASAANAVLYQLNNEFKNVSRGLEAKAEAVGGAKDTAVDLQRRANELATSATNKLSSIYGNAAILQFLMRETTSRGLHFPEVEKEYEDTERRLLELSSELVELNCEMMIHLQVG